MSNPDLLLSFRTRAFWTQVYLATFSNLKSRYRNTFAGMFWVILGPLVVYGVQSFIFTKVLWINIPDYSQFLLSGLLAWIFVSQSVDQCTSLLTNQRGLLTAFTVNPLVLILAQILDNFLNFIIVFFVLITPLMMFADTRIRLGGLLVFPLATLILLIGTFSMCWIFAAVNVFFRDTRFIIGFAMSVAYYLTPIFYPISMVPVEFRFILQCNPLYRIIEPLRASVYYFEPTYFWTVAGEGFLVASGLLFVAILLWRRKRNDIFLRL